MENTVNTLRHRAEAEAARLPPLLTEAERLAGAVLLGEHGRRRAGQGDDFWQYRLAQPGDGSRAIDWRRSARSDVQYVRQREWQIAQDVMLWVDPGASMRFSSDKSLPEKRNRASVLALAIAVLLLRGGERVGMTGAALAPRRGKSQLLNLAEALLQESQEDYASPDMAGLVPHGRALLLSDFMSPLDGLRDALTAAADRGVRGILFQVLDPAEEVFPYAGRTIFESVGGGLAHETLKADRLRDRYLARLGERKSDLAALCKATNWRFAEHHTNQTAQSALLWLYRALEGETVA